MDFFGSGEYKDKNLYEIEFNRLYRSSTILDMRNKRIILGVVNQERDWAHVCFGKAGMESMDELFWDSDRAMRIGWIKEALQNGQKTTIHQSREYPNRELYYYCTGGGNSRHEGCDHLIVVTEVVDEKSLNFYTAYNITREQFIQATSRLPRLWQPKQRKKP